MTSSSRVIDVTNPTPPVEIGVLERYEWGGDLSVANGIVYLKGIDGCVDVVDATVPSSPTWLGCSMTPGIPSGLVADGWKVYVADDRLGMIVLQPLGCPGYTGPAPPPRPTVRRVTP